MINGQRVLGVIPARGGSKGVPGKNIRHVNGKPLIAWTILQAQRSVFLDRLIVSTDDPEILSVSREFNCEAPFIRKQELAQDNSKTIDVILDAIEKIPGYDLVVVLQPTSPLRVTQDIDGAISECALLNAPSCVSVCKAQESPFLMFDLNVDKLLKPYFPDDIFKRRQDLPDAYLLNGAIYIADIKWLQLNNSFITNETVGYEMPADRSIDIDTELDFLNLNMQWKAHNVSLP